MLEHAAAAIAPVLPYGVTDVIDRLGIEGFPRKGHVPVVRS